MRSMMIVSSQSCRCVRSQRGAFIYEPDFVLIYPTAWILCSKTFDGGLRANQNRHERKREIFFGDLFMVVGSAHLYFNNRFLVEHFCSSWCFDVSSVDFHVVLEKTGFTRVFVSPQTLVFQIIFFIQCCRFFSFAFSLTSHFVFIKSS